MKVNKKLVVVLGMHRSGTSVITRGLSALGVELGDNLMKPIEGNNTKGFYEDLSIYELNEKILLTLGSDWHSLSMLDINNIQLLREKGLFEQAVKLIREKVKDKEIFGFKDPRTARLLPFWQEVFSYCGCQMSYVIALRNPLDVADSLQRREGFPSIKSWLMWLHHVLISLKLTEGKTRVIVEFGSILEDPAGNLERIASDLNLPLDKVALNKYVTEFLDSVLLHSSHDKDELENSDCLPLAKEIYIDLIRRLGSKEPLETVEFSASIKRWWNEFERMREVWHWIDTENQKNLSLRQQISSIDTQVLQAIRLALEIDKEAFRSVFDSVAYLQRYPDVAAAKLDPYIHYVEQGGSEGRKVDEHPLSILTGGILGVVRDRQNCIQSIEKNNLKGFELGESIRVYLSEHYSALAAEYSGLISSLKEDLDKAKGAMNEAERSHAAALAEQKSQHIVEIAGIRKENQSNFELSERRLSALVAEYSSLIASQKSLHAEEISGIRRESQSTLEMSEGRLSALAAEYSGLIASLKNDLDMAKDAMRELERSHATALAEQKSLHNEEVADIRRESQSNLEMSESHFSALAAEYSGVIASLKSDLDMAKEAMSELERSHATAMAEQKLLHAEEIAAIRRENQLNLEMAESRFSALAAEYSGVIASLKNDLDMAKEAMSELERGHATAIAEQKSLHTEEIAGIRRENQSNLEASEARLTALMNNINDEKTSLLNRIALLKSELAEEKEMRENSSAELKRIRGWRLYGLLSWVNR